MRYDVFARHFSNAMSQSLAIFPSGNQILLIHVYHLWVWTPPDRDEQHAITCMCHITATESVGCCPHRVDSSYVWSITIHVWHVCVCVCVLCVRVCHKYICMPTSPHLMGLYRNDRVRGFYRSEKIFMKIAIYRVTFPEEAAPNFDKR